jgi:threonine aldolase
MAAGLCEALALEGILIGRGDTIRLVTHLGVTAADVERTVAAFKRFFAA